LRILLSGLSGSLAHASRVVALGRALAERGHEVHLAGGPGFLDDPILVSSDEFMRHRVAEPSLAQIIGQGQGPGWFDRALADDRALLERVAPDLVVFDNRRTAGLAARLAGVRTLSLTNAPLLGPHLGWSPSVESFLGLLGPVLGLDPERLRQNPSLAGRAPHEPVPLQQALVPPALRAGLERAGLPVPPALHHLSLGDVTAVCDHPALHPLQDPPPGVEPVGPVLPCLRVGLPRWWDTLSPDRPVVLVSFGSTGTLTARDAVLQALCALDVQVLATGLAPDQAPSGVRAASWLPGAEAAARADLVVCHGGSGTIYQALAAGTPVVCLPGHLEQALNSLAAARVGVGVTVAARVAVGAPDELSAMLARALDNQTLQERAQALSAQLDPAAAVDRCVALGLGC